MIGCRKELEAISLSSVHVPLLYASGFVWKAIVSSKQLHRIPQSSCFTSPIVCVLMVTQLLPSSRGWNGAVVFLLFQPFLPFSFVPNADLWANVCLQSQDLLLGEGCTHCCFKNQVLAQFGLKCGSKSAAETKASVVVAPWGSDCHSFAEVEGTRVAFLIWVSQSWNFTDCF